MKTHSDLKLRGLSQAEAERRLIEYGPNALPERERVSVWRRLIRQFKSTLIYILLFAFALDLVLWLHEGAKSVPYEAVAIALILILKASAIMSPLKNQPEPTTQALLVLQHSPADS